MSGNWGGGGAVALRERRSEGKGKGEGVKGEWLWQGRRACGTMDVQGSGVEGKGRREEGSR